MAALFFPLYHSLPPADSSTRIWLDNVECSSTVSTHLLACSHRGAGVVNCSHFHDVALECRGPFTPPETSCMCGECYMGRYRYIVGGWVGLRRLLCWRLRAATQYKLPRWMAVALNIKMGVASLFWLSQQCHHTFKILPFELFCMPSSLRVYMPLISITIWE